MARLETGEFRDEPHPEFGWVRAPAGRYRLDTGPARRRHLRRGPQDRAGAGALSRRGCTHERRVPGSRTSKLGRGHAARCARALRRSATSRPRPGAPAEGFAVGYHLFDADTGTLIVDGARVHPERDVAPGESAQRARWTSTCRRKTAATRCCLSPMREDVCWYYEQGWPFLLVEAATRRRRGARWSACAWPRAPRSRASAQCAPSGRAFVYPLLTHLAQSQPDPRDGAARHSGPLPRLVRRRRSGPSSIRCC